MDHVVVDKQMSCRRGDATGRFEPDRRQPVEESPPAAGDPWRDHEPEFVDDVRGEQCLGDRDTGMDADVAPGPQPLRSTLTLLL